MRARQTILKIAMIFLASGLVWFADANAAIYKWKDENGKTHFTDDPTKVPEVFRNKPFIKDPKAPAETPKPRKKGEQGEEGETSDKKSGAEKPEAKEGDKQEGLTEAQRPTAEAVISFLREDIARYEIMYGWPPSRSKFRLLKEAVAAATPQKQALLEQVSQHDLPVFVGIAELLKTSIAEDEKSQKIMPTTITSTRQTQALINRLKAETEQENQLLEQLTTALGSKN